MHNIEPNGGALGNNREATLVLKQYQSGLSRLANNRIEQCVFGGIMIISLGGFGGVTMEAFAPM